MGTSRRGFLLALAAALLAQAALSSPAHGLELRKVGSFSQPVYATAPAGEKRRLYVAERAGRIAVLQRGRRLRRPFLRITGLVDLAFPRNQFRDQGGLLSMAFSPDYRRSGLLYLLYTHRDGTIHLDEFRRTGNGLRARRSSRRTVLTLPRRSRTDLGGHLEFGPDGYLYASLGIGADSELAQDLGSLAGKILRIDPRVTGTAPYGVPTDNPFASIPGAQPEVFAYGLRNPWRFSFDPKSGDLLASDVGAERFEEVNWLPAGASGWNLGWPLFEGRRPYEGGSATGITFPSLTVSHSPAFCAIVGGYTMRGGTIPALRGRYLYGDVCSGRIHSVRLRGGRAAGRRSLRLAVTYLVSFGRDGRGRLYAVSLLGPVYRFTR